MNYKSYIFDFGRVLIDFDEMAMTQKYIPSAQDASIAKEVIFDLTYWHKLDTDAISDSEVKKDICLRLPEKLHEKAMQIFDNWYMMLPEIPGMRKIVTDLKQNGAKLYLLSNIGINFAANYHNNSNLKSLLSLFDGLVFSGPLGIAKPQTEIFEYTFKKYSLIPSECLFIDDNAQNIFAAEKTGLNTYLFDGNAQKLRNFIGL